MNAANSNTPRWVFFTSVRLYKWCQIAQSITKLVKIKVLFNVYLLYESVIWYVRKIFRKNLDFLPPDAYQAVKIVVFREILHAL